MHLLQALQQKVQAMSLSSSEGICISGEYQAWFSKLCWPRHAVVTAGMPYGNKSLHFGHVGGVFVPADVFARFLRDRIGADQVLFVSGTDCFGSPIDEGYRKLVEAGSFKGSIADYVQRNHEAQKHTLEAFGISLSLYEGSGIGRAGVIHQEVTNCFVMRLFERGWLTKTETFQFFDVEADTFLNGRQVVGRCPVQGCKSEHGYADECDLGHQYAPEDLIAPRSTITGTLPEMRLVENWYFDLPAFGDFLQDLATTLASDKEMRPVVAQTLKEFLAPPIIYIKNELRVDYEALILKLPAHTLREAESGKQSFEIEFASIADRDAARTVLGEAGVRFRTGKALAPFRITGNIEWGVSAPNLDNTQSLIVWCWPESLWAPLSFTMAALEAQGRDRQEWQTFWCTDDSEIYQFIGQDNLYFYGVAQPALWEALRPGNFMTDDDSAPTLRQTRLIANHHILFGKKKLSSSSEIKPPSADELLNYYTAEQLRAHFVALALDQKSVAFSPKPFDPDLEKRTDTRVADPVLKEAALLSNVFNRLARSCFYEAQKNFNGKAPLDIPSLKLLKHAHAVMDEYESLMHAVDLHAAFALADDFIRFSNKHWAEGIKHANDANDIAARRRVLAESFYLLRIATLLMHPIVPWGTELICDKLMFDPKRFFSWKANFDGLAELCEASEVCVGEHTIAELPPRFDFFERAPCAVAKEASISS